MNHSRVLRAGLLALIAAFLPLAAVAGKNITTIEGLGTPEEMHPLQAEWVKLSVPQCGYCQSGQIMSAAALLEQNPNPSAEDVEAAMAGNICRCGCYPRIKQAILNVAAANGKSVDELADELATEVRA